MGVAVYKMTERPSHVEYHVTGDPYQLDREKTVERIDRCDAIMFWNRQNCDGLITVARGLTPTMPHGRRHRILLFTDSVIFCLSLFS